MWQQSMWRQGDQHVVRHRRRPHLQSGCRCLLSIANAHSVWRQLCVFLLASPVPYASVDEGNPAYSRELSRELHSRIRELEYTAVYTIYNKSTAAAPILN